MVGVAKPLQQLIANDVMTPDPTTIPQEMSLRAAAHLLSQHRISGAPVVDAAGRCVGVLSTTDFVRWVEDGREKPVVSDYHCPWQVDEEELPADRVGTYMTQDPVAVTPDMPIAKLAQTMLDAHIHRVIVVDVERRPIGIISTTDILAAVARIGVPAHEPPTAVPHFAHH